MPRKPRIEYPGAFYHVIVRGNQKQRIFKDPSDFQKYLLTLTVYKNRAGCRIYCYVLMSNHVHLLVETGDIRLSKIMQGINQTYTQYFNRKYRTVGHLFQGRYKAILCDQEAYLLGLVKYIHENPLRAKIVERLDAYAWSSHHAYTGKNNPLGLVDTDQVLRLFSENRSRSRRRYGEFMAEQDGFDRKEVYATIDQRLKGDEDFIDSVLAQHEKDEKPKPWRRIALESIARAVSKRYGVTLDDLRSPIRPLVVALARKVLCILASQRGYKAVEIGRFLEKEPTIVTVSLKRSADVAVDVKEVERMLDNNPALQA